MRRYYRWSNWRAAIPRAREQKEESWMINIQNLWGQRIAALPLRNGIQPKMASVSDGRQGAGFPSAEKTNWNQCCSQQRKSLGNWEQKEAKARTRNKVGKSKTFLFPVLQPLAVPLISRSLQGVAGHAQVPFAAPWPLWLTPGKKGKLRSWETKV